MIAYDALPCIVLHWFKLIILPVSVHYTCSNGSGSLSLRDTSCSLHPDLWRLWHFDCPFPSLASGTRRSKITRQDICPTKCTSWMSSEVGTSCHFMCQQVQTCPNMCQPFQKHKCRWLTVCVGPRCAWQIKPLHSSKWRWEPVLKQGENRSGLLS